jgi:hypothetical protein
VPDKNVDDFELDSEPYTLEELAWGIARRTYHFWETASDKLADLEKPSAVAYIIRSIHGERINTIDRFEYHGILRRLEGESDLRYRRRLQLQRWKDALFERMSNRIRAVIGSARFGTWGIGPTGEQHEIARELASQIAIDLKANTLSTPDGGVVWRAVFVRQTAKALPAAASEQQRVGRPRKWDWERAMAYLVARANKPDGLPSVQADVEKMMAVYFERKHGASPAESLIREKVQLVFSALDQEKGQR